MRLLLFNVSFIGTCMKKDSTSKLTSRSVERSRIFLIFCMKCDSDFPVRDCNVCARKREVVCQKFMALTIGLRGDVRLKYVTQSEHNIQTGHQILFDKSTTIANITSFQESIEKP